MVTDDERREVAERLRSFVTDDSVYADVDAGRVLHGIGLYYKDIDRIYFSGFDVARLADLIEPQPITGDTSDGYHTFNELYDHRAKLFSVIVRCFKGRAWKSKLHHDGTMYEGMFIVGIETSQGQATYHYDIDPYWNVFDCKELARAPEWDGHTPEQAIFRIASLRPSCDRDALLALADKLECDGDCNGCDMGGGIWCGAQVYAARRIREACGEVGA